MTQMVHGINHVGDPQTAAGKILFATYAFLVLIMLHLYTGGSIEKLVRALSRPAWYA
jgi:hypothetical protein